MQVWLRSFMYQSSFTGYRGLGRQMVGLLKYFCSLGANCVSKILRRPLVLDGSGLLKYFCSLGANCVSKILRRRLVLDGSSLLKYFCAWDATCV